MSNAATVHRRKPAATGGDTVRVRVVPRRRCGSAVPDTPRSEMRAASLHPRATAAGNFVPDPVTAELAERAEHPLLAPSWRTFRTYAESHPELTELKDRGLVPTMRAHQGLRLGLFAVAAALVLLLVALLAYWWLLPATADADSPYATADTGVALSTPADQWERGVIPSLYQSDATWGDVPFGQATLSSTGAAPTALAMAYASATGDASLTPVDFAQWATDHDLTAAGVDTVGALLQQGGAAFGISVEPLTVEDRTLRHAIVSNMPVLIVTQPGTFAPTASVIVLDDIDKDSRIVLHDPTSETRSAKSWSFDDITDAAAAAFAVQAA